MQQLFEVCKDKMKQYLYMLSDDPFEAEACLNQEFRVGNVSGEKKDDPNLKLWDEFKSGEYRKDNAKMP